MARPKIPLISRRGALEAALRIIDEKGLEGLSIRVLGDELGINGTSLYHHFRNKEEMVVGAAQLALADVAPPPTEGVDWRVWLSEVARRYRDVLVAHPALISVIVNNRNTRVGTPAFNESAERLVEQGVPSAAVLPMLDAIEQFVVGSALHSAGSLIDPEFVDPSSNELLAKLRRDAGLSSDEIFGFVVDSIIEGVERAVADQIAKWTPQAASGPSGAA